MQPKTTLLCTFATTADLALTIEAIQRAYSVAFGSIYVLENTDEPGALCLTYNINTDAPITQPIPSSTISLHRKKQQNCLYTLNALNQLVIEQNGSLDHEFPINWSSLRNTILTTQHGELRKINTKLREIVKLGSSE